MTGRHEHTQKSTPRENSNGTSEKGLGRFCHYRKGVLNLREKSRLAKKISKEEL
jgi:hypothetical protein